MPRLASVTAAVTTGRSRFALFPPLLPWSIATRAHTRTHAHSRARTTYTHASQARLVLSFARHFSTQWRHDAWGGARLVVCLKATAGARDPHALMHGPVVVASLQLVPPVGWQAPSADAARSLSIVHVRGFGLSARSSLA